MKSKYIGMREVGVGLLFIRNTKSNTFNLTFKMLNSNLKEIEKKNIKKISSAKILFIFITFKH